MIRAGLMALVIAGPAGAETLAGQALCAAAWEKISAGLAEMAEVKAALPVQDGDWCLVEGLVLDQTADYQPDWHLDRVRFRGSALGWIAEDGTLPEGLELAVEGLRLVVQTGDARMDWLFAAQSRPNRIDARMALSWEPGAKVLRLENLAIDFPGENLIEGSAVVTGVDLSSDGAMQMSATGFAVTEADLNLQTHGLFESYVLMALGPELLPYEGDMAAAFAALQTEFKAALDVLPGTSFSKPSKAAMVALIDEMPNPAGDLTVAVRAEPGFGPVRFGGLALYGVEDVTDQLAPMLQGVTVEIGWTHADAP